MKFDLNQDEKCQLLDLQRRYLAARAVKDYEAAEKLEPELIAWGCQQPVYLNRIPDKEDPAHRKARHERRSQSKG